jgi:hypothetical protein
MDSGIPPIIPFPFNVRVLRVVKIPIPEDSVPEEKFM